MIPGICRRYHAYIDFENKDSNIKANYPKNGLIIFGKQISFSHIIITITEAMVQIICRGYHAYIDFKNKDSNLKAGYLKVVSLFLKNNHHPSI